MSNLIMDFTRHASLVMGTCLTDVPVKNVYTGVVSLCGLQMITFLAELNGKDLWAHYFQYYGPLDFAGMIDFPNVFVR
jgi:hypothetical protein